MGKRLVQKCAALLLVHVCKIQIIRRIGKMAPQCPINYSLISFPRLFANLTPKILVKNRQYSKMDIDDRKPSRPGLMNPETKIAFSPFNFRVLVTCITLWQIAKFENRVRDVMAVFKNKYFSAFLNCLSTYMPFNNSRLVVFPIHPSSWADNQYLPPTPTYANLCLSDTHESTSGLDCSVHNLAWSTD